MTQRVSTTLRNTPFKTCVDIASALFVATFIIGPWWMYLSVSLQRGPITGNSPVPTMLPLEIWMADGFPFLFGAVWLLYRYLEAIRNKFPRFFRWMRFSIVITTFVAIGIPVFLMRLNWR